MHQERSPYHYSGKNVGRGCLISHDMSEEALGFCVCMWHGCQCTRCWQTWLFRSQVKILWNDVMHAAGSWSSSCSPLQWNNDWLTVICPAQSNAQQPTVATMINYGLCAPGASVSFDSGSAILTCSQLNSTVPDGSWSKSCAPLSWNGTVLQALCGAT
jgi:hypothetical protein